jgi:hypothetical protein
MISHKKLSNNFSLKIENLGQNFFFGVQYFEVELSFNKNHGKSSLLDLKKSTPVVATRYFRVYVMSIYYEPFWLDD